MRSLPLFLACGFLLVNSFGQQLPAQQDSMQLPRNVAMTKSNNRNTLGWVFLVGGGIMGVVGFTQAHRVMNDDNIGFSEGLEEGAALMTLGITGSTLALISIPLFVSAGKYKRHAMEISMDNKPLMVYPGSQQSRVRQTALTLKISLGK